MSFGWNELFGGNRFWVPVSEAALLEAGRAADLRGGMTLLEPHCGNGAISVFFAEEFHVYARGVESAADLLEGARALAARSAAGGRVRFRARQLHGPVDVLCALRRPVADAACRRMLLGRFLADDVGLAKTFPVAPKDPPGTIVWRRSATPLEWERFYDPQERALRRYRRGLRDGEELSSVALAADRQIEAFRSHGNRISYELLVCEP